MLSSTWCVVRNLGWVALMNDSGRPRGGSGVCCDLEPVEAGATVTVALGAVEMAAGRVDSLFTSATDGDSAPMTSHASVECIKGVGIAGDRYSLAAEGARFEAEQNTHWHLPEVGRQLTLFDT
eukprot:COSAG04_NODE_11067_length_733_cov_0.960568_1_plen_122_part_10